MSKLFIVNGKGHSGKTTFEKYVAEIAKQDNHNVYVGSTIDWVKELATQFGYCNGKTIADRQMLCNFKILLKQYNDSPYQYMCNVIKENWNKTIALLIDSREPEEIKRFVDNWNATTVLVQKPHLSEIYNNPADDNAENYNYDITIINDSNLADLKKKSISFYETYIKP